MNYFNLIDDYLANRMNDADKAAFESRLAADPGLKQEFIFQKDVVNSIQLERKNQLKSMLNDIPVSSSSGSQMGNALKVAGTIVGIGAIITGAYFYVQNEKAESPATPPPLEEQIPVISNNEEPAQLNPQHKFDTQEDAAQPVERLPKAESAEEIKKPTEAEAETPQVKRPAEIKTPNVIDNFESENSVDDIAEPEVFTETEEIIAEELFDSNIEVIIDNSQKKFDFHYQYKEDKLFLYGKFDKGLYEILEFNNESGKTIIFYYKDSYYLINNNQKEITPLKPIADSSLTEKLDKLRE